jgi:hypothetical protein
MTGARKAARRTASKYRDEGCGGRYHGEGGVIAAAHILHVCRWHSKPDAFGRVYHVCPCGARSLV